MAKSTGPILAMGALVLANKTIIHRQPMDWRIPIATGLAGGMFAVFEKGWETAAVSLAWMAFVVTIFVRVDPQTPPPIESLEKWWTSGAQET